MHGEQFVVEWQYSGHKKSRAGADVTMVQCDDYHTAFRVLWKDIVRVVFKLQPVIILTHDLK